MSTKVDIVERQPRRKNRNKNKKHPVANRLARINTIANGRQALKMMGLKPKAQVNRNRRRNRNNKNPSGYGSFPGGNKQGQNFRSGKTSNESDMEYIGEVTATSTTFVVNQTLACNPGQASVFPWLSKKAQLYEKYQFKSLEFIYKPEVSSFATLGTEGKVILSFDYDSSDAPPTSKQQAEDTDPSADDLPSKEICLKMRPADLHKNSDAKFVRPAGLPGGSDIKTFDCGNLYVSTSGLAASSGTLGEIWVRYNCILSVPILESTASAPTNYFVTALFDNAAVLTSTVTHQPLLAAANSTTVVSVNGIGVVNTAGSVVPPPGNYILDVQTFFSFTGLATATVLEIQKNGNTQNVGVGHIFTSGALTEDVLSQSIYISCNGTDAITLVVEATFTTGSGTAYTSFRLVAI
jgi:hypothetical protein